VSLAFYYDGFLRAAHLANVSHLAKSYSHQRGRWAAPGGAPQDAGDRRSGVDFTYRVPENWRDWVPVLRQRLSMKTSSRRWPYPRKSCLPGRDLSARDSRNRNLISSSGSGSTVPGDFTTCVAVCFYVNSRYPDGSYTNSGNLMGSWRAWARAAGSAGCAEHVLAYVAEQNPIQLFVI